MLSFISMGNRKKRQRKKSIRVVGVSPGSRNRERRRTSRGSGSFMSPGDVGEIIEKRGVRPNTVGEPSTRRDGKSAQKDGASSAMEQFQASPLKSPEIQLEFKHDSLLQSLPKEFLKYRKGSTTSSVDELGATRSPFSQVSDRTVNTEGSPRDKRLTHEKARRMAPMPTVTPIQIPSSPLLSISTHSQKRSSRVRRSQATNSLAWASDSEVSPVSGVSAARDVLSKSFSFSARTPAFGDALLSRDRDTSQRTARQDSATLPRDLMWDGVRSASVSRKSSTHSIKRRKRDTTAAESPPDLPAIDAFVLSPTITRSGEKPKFEVNDSMRPSAPPRTDSMRVHQRDGPTAKTPIPPSLTPSSQKLAYAEQAALHRISRITETDAELSSMSLTPPVSGSTSSFSSQSKKSQKPKLEGSLLGSPFRLQSTLSTPSTYSKYTGSPSASPGKRPVPYSAGMSSGKTDYDCESFLEDFQFVGPSSGPSSQGETSGSGSAYSPYGVQIPMTAISVSTMNESKSTSASGSSEFPHGSPKLSHFRRMQMKANDGKPFSASAYSKPSAIALGRDSLGGKIGVTSINSVLPKVGNSPSSNLRSKEHTLNTTPLATKDQVSYNGPMVEVSRPRTPDSENRRPSLPHLQVTNPGLSPSSAATSPSPLSSLSPDLLDMLIPNGHIVTPISRRQIGRKRSGSTPSPIRITPQRSVRYLPMNGEESDDGDESKMELRGGNQEEDSRRDEISPGTGDTQTFPETPVLFSPDFAISRSNSLMSDLKHHNPNSRLKNALPLQSLTVAASTHITQTRKLISTPSQVPEAPQKDNEASSLSTTITNSPPISPLQPPPSSPFAQIQTVQTPFGNAILSPPLLAPVPKRKTVHIRPPLPFGPRKPNSSSIGRSTAPLSFVRRSCSETAADISRNADNSTLRHKTPDKVITLGTPTFNTSPLPWRGLTLDAAKWTFSSSQLQDIVRTAIERSAQASSIRLLPQDDLNEISLTFDKLDARRQEVQMTYKVLVRRRRSIMLRLLSTSSNGARVDPMSIVRDVEDLANVTASCDQLVEELYSINDQLSQIGRLRDMHQASALAVALRKLNSSLAKQSNENRNLHLEITNLYGERNEAWRKAEELEHELDALDGHLGSSRPKSVSSSRRSSRVSLARKNSSRTSKAGLRLSGYSYRRTSHRSSGSSLVVNHATSARSTFSSDVVPPVPPLPNIGATIHTSISSSSALHSPTSLARSSTNPNSSDGLYNDVYDLLGIKGSDRPISSPFRPHSAVYHTSLSEYKNIAGSKSEIALHSEFALRSMRAGSLPSLIPTNGETQDTNAIIAMLDFHE